jgi:hypothetical protein
MGYDTSPPILVQKCHDGLRAYDRLSADALADHPTGQVYICKPRKGRTAARNAAYWAGLGMAVKATDHWPTAAHLHADLKRLCGYVDIYHNPLTGRDEVRPQSTAFDKMTEAEFSAFFRLAQLKFTERMGFDPWAREHDGAGK